MNENDNVQDAQVVEKSTVNTQLEAFRTQVTTNRDDFKKQLTQVKEAIELRNEEIKNLTIKQRKLEGAIEASELLLKPTPTSK
jgi:hypothetical protein